MFSKREYIPKQINVFAKVVGKRIELLLNYEIRTCNGKVEIQEYES